MLSRIKTRLLRTLMRRFTSHAPAAPAGLAADVRRIALWQFSGIGDMLLATPAIRALGAAWPQAEIHVWCSHPEAAEWLRRFPNVGDIHAMPVFDFDARTLWHGRARRRLLAVRDDARAWAPDLLVNLHIPALLDWWAVEWWLIRQLKPAFAIGFDPPFLRRKSIYAVSLSAAERDGVHYTTLYARLLGKAGIACDGRTVFPLSEPDRASAVGLLAGQGGADGPKVCLHVGGNRLRLENKMWPVGRFAELARRLLEGGMVPVLVGTDAERAIGDELSVMVPACVNLIGRTRIGDMAALIAMAEGFIGHDSGPFHIAAAVGTPCVAICGRPDAEDEYLKYNRDDVGVVRGDDPLLIGVNEVYACAMDVFAHRSRG